jgi:hypothetical protein
MMRTPWADEPNMGGLRQGARVWIAMAILALVLLPSALIAWQWRAMPHLGAWHDDAVYVVSAKSLATGSGYRLLNLPGEPPQTKYPPLYPLLLSLVWRIAPSFPANLPWTMLLQWGMLPVLAALLWTWFRRVGFGIAAAVALTALVVLCPMTTMFATTPLTEIPFLIAILAVLLVIGEGAVTMDRAVLAGLCAAAAVLIRTNGIVLAVAIPLALWRSEPKLRLRKIAGFLAPLIAAVAAWEIWCALVRVPASTDLLSYYTDYAGFYRHTFSITDLPHRLWLNMDGLLTSIGRLVAWSTSEGIAYRQLCWFLSVLAIGGWIELWRRGQRGAAWFAALFGGLLIVWNFPPDQRFVYPLLPFAAAGIGVMGGKVVSRLPVEWAVGRISNRIAASVMACCMAAALLAIVLLDVHAYRETLPSWIAEQRARSSQMRPVYQWIAHETPSASTVAAYDDPLLYLYTGRHAVSVAVMPTLVYQGSDRALAAYVRSTVREWNAANVQYAVTTPADFRREFQETARDAEFSELQTSWRPVFQTTGAVVWAQREAVCAGVAVFGEGCFGFSSSLKIGASTPSSIGPR